LLREREATLNVDEKAEERYLMLPELGRVLQALREALPGVCTPTLRVGISNCSE